jgi:hypothetical protein
VQLVDDFLTAIDERWTPSPSDPPKTRLRIIGCSALLLQTDYARGTKDSDVLESADLPALTKARLLELAGVGTDLHARYKHFLEFVPGGLPFLRQIPRWHPRAGRSAPLQHFEIEVLDVVDVVVSKLKRLHADDASDIEAMVERGLVAHASALECFREAVEFHALGAGADDLERCRENFHWLERDVLGVAETEIDLPDWA